MTAPNGQPGAWATDGHPWLMTKLAVDVEGEAHEGVIRACRDAGGGELEFVIVLSDGREAVVGMQDLAGIAGAEQTAVQEPASGDEAMAPRGGGAESVNMSSYENGITTEESSHQTWARQPPDPPPPLDRATPAKPHPRTALQSRNLPNGGIADRALTVADVEVCKDLVRRLAAPHFAREFCQPVQHLHPEVAQRYHTLIRRPMDLGSVYVKLCRGSYRSLTRFRRDVLRVFINCQRYNAMTNSNHCLVSYAKHLYSYAKALFVEMLGADTEERERYRRMRLERCGAAKLSTKDCDSVKAVLARLPNANATVLTQLHAAFTPQSGLTVSNVFEVVNLLLAAQHHQACQVVLQALHLVSAAVYERIQRGTELSSIWAQPARLVWAAQGKQAYAWPGMVLMHGGTSDLLTHVNGTRMPAEHRKVLSRHGHKANAVVVETFGAHDFFWAPMEKLTAYTGPTSDPNGKPPKKALQEFLRGVAEIEMAQKLLGALAADDDDDMSRLDRLDLATIEEVMSASNDVESDGAEDLEEYVPSPAEVNAAVADAPSVKGKGAGGTKKGLKEQQAECRESSGAVASGRRKTTGGQKLMKQRAIDKIREFVEQHSISDKVQRELKIDNRPKVKRKVVNIPRVIQSAHPSYSRVAATQPCEIERPVLFGGKPPFALGDPYETDSDFEDVMEDEPGDWSDANVRKAALRRREAVLIQQLAAMKEMQLKQREMAERAVGRKILWHVDPSLGQDHVQKRPSNGAAATGGTRPRQAGVKRPRPTPPAKPVADAGAGAGSVAAAAESHPSSATITATKTTSASASSASYQRSQYTGVSKNGNRWMARISYNGKKHSLGGYDTEVEAAHAYDRAAREHFGPKAKCNFNEHGLSTGLKMGGGGRRQPQPQRQQQQQQAPAPRPPSHQQYQQQQQVLRTHRQTTWAESQQTRFGISTSAAFGGYVGYEQQQHPPTQLQDRYHHPQQYHNHQQIVSTSVAGGPGQYWSAIAAGSGQIGRSSEADDVTRAAEHDPRRGTTAYQQRSGDGHDTDDSDLDDDEYRRRQQAYDSEATESESEDEMPPAWQRPAMVGR